MLGLLQDLILYVNSTEIGVGSDRSVTNSKNALFSPRCGPNLVAKYLLKLKMLASVLDLKKTNYNFTNEKYQM